MTKYLSCILDDSPPPPSHRRVSESASKYDHRLGATKQIYPRSVTTRYLTLAMALHQTDAYAGMCKKRVRPVCDHMTDFLCSNGTTLLDTVCWHKWTRGWSRYGCLECHSCHMIIWPFYLHSTGIERVTRKSHLRSLPPPLNFGVYSIIQSIYYKIKSNFALKRSNLLDINLITWSVRERKKQHPSHSVWVS